MEETLDKTVKIAGVRFRENWKVYDFDASDIEIAVGDRVIVDSDRGPGFASVVRIRRTQVMPVHEPAPMPVQKQEVPEGIEIDIDGEEDAVPSAKGQAPKATRRVLRKATEDDMAREEKNREREAEAFSMAQDMITEREMAMKLIRVEYSFDASRATFFFFSENRIDFRELVKDLAYKLKSRIEMRQIGVRDVARMIGGFGPCGRELCCSSFLKNFEPVSIRMAKKQEMVLNPAKISGVCGRLLCCLSYEYEMYEANKKDQADLRQTAIKEKKDEEERRVAQERKAVEEQQQADRKRQEERRQQDQRQGKQKEGGQRSGGKPEKKKEQPERKGQQERKAGPPQGEQRQRQPKPEKQQQPRPERQQPRQDRPPQPRTEKQPQDQQVAAGDAQPQQGQQPSAADGDKGGKRKRRRFWRKKKKGQGGGEGQAPQGPQGGGNPPQGS